MSATPSKELTQLPQAFCRMMENLGLDDALAALAASGPVVSVRHNAAKGQMPAPGADRVPWCGRGEYLAQRPVFALDPRWHQGCYYVQEGASMYAAAAVAHAVALLSPQGQPLALLDACAAPGGKTTAAIDALPAGSLTVANEYVPARAAVLRENIIKWGNPSTVVTRGDTAALARLGEAFDIVLADVPCSGEGMMRKDNDAIAQWGLGLIEECAALQWDIVHNLWDTLRPGGVMIYSTCTFNTLENEAQVGRMASELGAECLQLPLGDAWHVTPSLDPSVKAVRFVPGRTRGEGLFVAALRKPGIFQPWQATTARHKAKGNPRRAAKGTAAVPGGIGQWLAAPDRYDIYAAADRITAFPTRWMPLLGRLQAVTDVIHEGVHLAVVKGRDAVPAHALAMSTALARGFWPECAVDTDTALAYLRGQSPALPQGSPKGYTLLTYDGQPLGWVKNLGNRTNSLYPAPWRLRI